MAAVRLLLNESMNKGVLLLKILKILFWIVIALNSFLLFLVEPMFNRMLLPVAGSSMSVWNIALMCFQILLLCGYVYTHYLPQVIGYKAYMRVHVALLMASALFSFLFFTIKNFTVDTSSPSLDIILILLSTIGVPFFVVSTSSTNFQRWYGATYRERPYHLYSLSNGGNLLALIGYGLLVEVLFGLKSQILIWNILYAAAVAIGVYIGITVYRNLGAHEFIDVTEQSAQGEKETIGFKRKMVWLWLSFIPCSLMIATNTVLDNTINVNHIHYFWILPLAIYLIAYIIAFSRFKLFDSSVYEKVALWLSITMLGILFLPFYNYVYIVAMLALFMVSLVCNIYLVQDAPHESSLTEFYLYIAIGGALGGIVSSIMAPLVFNNVYEYPIIIMMFLFTMLGKHMRDKVELFAIEPWEYSILFVAVLCIVLLNGLSIKLISLLGFLCLFVSFTIRRLYIYPKSRLVALMILVFFTLAFNHALLRPIDYQARNFYGIKTVKTSDYTDKEGNKHKLVHLLVGNTLHGSQFEKGSTYEFEALTYYDRTGSTVGRFFTTNKDKVRRVGVVGLGVGTLSAVSDEGQEWKYFEIDPQITAIAKNPNYFTMMDRYQHEVVMGDARVTLQAEKEQYYDVLVLDAYSGDMIPANLLTKEAVELYKRKLKDQGILFFHISNRQFELKPVVSTVADAIGVDCYVDTAQSRGSVVITDSVWVMVTNNKDFVSDTWAKIEKYPDFEVWTDDKYSIASVLKE